MLPTDPSMTASSSKVTLDTTPPCVADLLSYPTSRRPEQPQGSQHDTAVIKEKLYVGNLHPSVDEYALIKLFSQYGKVASLDFLFHKSGPLKGRPRGYAFVEYTNAADARTALDATNDKLLKGRKISVTFANFASIEAVHRPSDSGKHTALSLLKSGPVARGKDIHSSTSSKIAELEAKLFQMSHTREDGSTAPLSETLHPSLPAKPSLPSTVQPDTAIRPKGQRIHKELPTLPLPTPTTPDASSSRPQAKKLSGKSKTSMVGVRFRKNVGKNPS